MQIFSTKDLFLKRRWVKNGQVTGVIAPLRAVQVVQVKGDTVVGQLIWTELLILNGYHVSIFLGLGEITQNFCPLTQLHF